MSKERLLSAFSESELVKDENNFDNERLKKIRKDFNELRDQIELRRNLYDIKNLKNLLTQKIKEIGENVFKSEECLSNLKKYRLQDDFRHRKIRDIRNLFNQSIDEDYYKPTKTKSAFNGNYIEYESKGEKNKNLSVKEYLHMIIPYLSDIITNYKALGKLKIHSGNNVIDYKTPGEWKVQLLVSINFVSFKDSDEIRTMHTKSDNIDILMASETYDIIKYLFKSF